MLITLWWVVFRYPLTKRLLHVKLAVFNEVTLSREGVF